MIEPAVEAFSQGKRVHIEKHLHNSEEIAELEKITDDTLNSFKVINEKYKDMKSEVSNTENVNIEDIDAAITDLIKSYQDNVNCGNDRVYEIYVNSAKRILDE